MKILDDLPFGTISKVLKLTKEATQSLYDTAIKEFKEELAQRGIQREDLMW